MLKYMDMDDILAALAVSRRREILKLIQNQELSSGEIASHFASVTGPAISQHLKILRDAQLVSVRHAGTRRLYKARPEALTEIRDYLDSFWSTGLQQLKRAAEAEERKGNRDRRRARS